MDWPHRGFAAARVRAPACYVARVSTPIVVAVIALGIAVVSAMCVHVWHRSARGSRSSSLGASKGSGLVARRRSSGPPQTVQIEGPSGETLATVSRLPEHPSGMTEQLTVHPQLRTSMSSILGPTMQVMAAGMQASSAAGVLSLRFSPEVAAMLASGAAQQMQSAAPGAMRAIAKGADGRIVGNAEVLTGTNWALAATAAWQIAGIVTAQKFLADINAKLGDIAAGVRDIRQFLDDKEHADLEADFRYLQHRAHALARGDVDFSERLVIANQLDAIERRSGAAFSLYLRQLDRCTEDVKKMQENASSWWSTDDSRQALEVAITRASERSMALVVAAQARAVAIGLRDMLHLNRQTSIDLRDALQEDVERAPRSWEAFKIAVRNVSDDMSAAFEWESTTKRQRRAVARALRANTKQNVEMLASVQEAARALPSRTISEMELSLVLDAQGEIVELRASP